MENFTLPCQLQKTEDAKPSPEEIRPSFDDVVANMTLKELEIAAIKAAFARIGNNKLKVAKTLGITARGLYNKLHSYGLMEDFEDPKLYKKPTKAKLMAALVESRSINEAARKLSICRTSIRKYMKIYSLTSATINRRRSGDW